MMLYIYNIIYIYIYIYICAPIARCLSPDVPAPQSPATHRHPEWPSGQIWPNPSKLLYAQYTRHRFGKHDPHY